MLYDLTVVQISKMLKNLSAILEKAERFSQTKKINIEVLLNSRLAPDQHGLIFQVQFLCDSAMFTVARLTNQVDNLEKPEDTETTLAQLQARIQLTLDYLAKFTPKDFIGAETRKIIIPERWQEKYITGLEFAIQRSIPGFYFHITTVYSILRHNGVELIKKDFLGNLPFKENSSKTS